MYLEKYVENNDAKIKYLRLEARLVYKMFVYDEMQQRNKSCNFVDSLA